MKYYGKFREVRFCDITPGGSLRTLLEKEKTGIPGHLNEIGYPFDKPCWSTKEATESWAANWWPYEQSAYWIDSLVRTAALLDDEALYEKVRGQVEAALEQADPYIGPDIIRGQGNSYRWPHAVLFRALYALWSKTGDERIMEKMRAHFLNDRDYDYAYDRNIVGVEMMLRVAEHFGDDELFALAERNMEKYLESFAPASDYLFYQMNGLPDEFNPHKDDCNMFGNYVNLFHGVSYNEIGKLPAVYYLYSGKQEALDLTKKIYRVIENKHMMPDGVNSSGEFLIGTGAQVVHESCDISDFTWSMGYLLEATGDSRYADKIEWAMLNAYPAAMDENYRSFQYFSSVNQVVAARDSCYLRYFADEKMAFQPLHNPQCCAGNLGRALPNYLLRFYQESEDGLAVSLYGDVCYHGRRMELRQSGGYPYGDEAYLDVIRAEEGKNCLKLRLPAWSIRTELLLNGEPVRLDPVNGYQSVYVHAGDRLCLRTKKQFEPHDGTDGGVYFTYGPFLLSLKIEEKRETDPLAKLATEDFPAFNLTPASEWRYAVSGFEEPTLEKPLCDGGAPFEISIAAKRLKGWELKRSISARRGCASSRRPFPRPALSGVIWARTAASRWCPTAARICASPFSPNTTPSKKYFPENQTKSPLRRALERYRFKCPPQAGAQEHFCRFLPGIFSFQLMKALRRHLFAGARPLF